MDFNITVQKKSTDMVLQSILQLIFKKLPLVKLWYNIRGEYLQLSEKKKLLKFFFSTFELCKAGFSSHASIKEHMVTDWIYIYICENLVVSYYQTFKRFAKIKWWCSTHYFSVLESTGFCIKKFFYINIMGLLFLNILVRKHIYYQF